MSKATVRHQDAAHRHRVRVLYILCSQPHRAGKLAVKSARESQPANTGPTKNAGYVL